MKILTNSQQSGLTQQIADRRAEGTASDDTRQKAAAKAGARGDSVVLSTALDTELKTQQAQQAMRVESIKSLVKSGKYQVSSLAVAEKMLSGTSKK